ncbi:MAG TPA: hypothetical protein VIH72_13175 [Candidatus Acidoferrales bacterium]
MHTFLIPLFGGLIAIFAVAGVGKLFLHLAGIRNLPWYWKIAFTALAGQAAVIVLVEVVLLSGAGAASGLRLVAWLLVGVATIGHLFFSESGAGRSIRELFRADKIITAVLLLAAVINLVVALAPSTKIDELYYHMLTPKRIVEDGGLRFYLLPIESAIVPQMHYQISLSVAHASGAPDAGNALSWGYSVALLLFMMGFLMDATKNRHLSVLCVALCGVGIYATVWHTTGGAHALGDLATVVALAALLRPALLLDKLGPYRYAFMLAMAAAVAASTKLSLVPLSLVASGLIVVQAIRAKTPSTKVSNVIGLALLPWIVIHLLLMIWTYRASGSFWGPVLANVFGHSAFPPSILQDIADLQGFSPASFAPMARYAVAEFTPVFFISIIWILWTALRGCKTSRLVAGLLLLQGGIVAWKFHFDFRFLGGLEFVAVLAAALTLASPAETDDSPNSSDTWTHLAVHLVNWRRWLLLFAAIPWLAFQIYYARPFAEVVSGLTPRSEFMKRYVALTSDFEMLDKILPRDAVIYIPDARWPNFYAPRPVVLTPLDLRSRGPIFSLATPTERDVQHADVIPSLKCGDTIYQNDRALVETYRTPGEAPFIGAIKVQACELQPSGAQR